MRNLDQQLVQVRRCTLCEDLPLGPNPILQAAPTSRILIAGQAPGRRAHQSGVPFDDPSGNRLREWLGVDRATFYDPSKFAILPMGFCYPGTGSGGDLPPRPECAPTWRQTLLDQLPDFELKLVIGAFAHRWHLRVDAGASITETVRNWRDHWPRALPMPHPSPRNNRWLARNPYFEREVIPELQARVREILGGG
ncbi:MAG: uracil-DNA glycosylase family protein [Pseudomonadales bacterium]